jgi:hypothetical protein
MFTTIMTPETQGQPQKQSAGEKALLIVDTVMLLLLVANLLFIIFDWAFSYSFFRSFIHRASDSFYNYYSTQVHPDFILYDIYFVIVFVAEIILRWIIAVARKTYGRWYFYPIVHWYDVLGAIPFGPFRFLRLLRLYALTKRLHKLGVIDLKNTYLYQKLILVYDIIMEEITDHVIINLLDEIKKEIVKQSTAEENTFAEIVKPHQREIAKWLTNKIQSTTESSYVEYKKDLHRIVEETVQTGFKNSTGIKRIERVPLVGKQLISSLEETISDASFELIDSSAINIYTEKNRQLIEDAIASTIENLFKKGETDEEINTIVKDICAEVIERMKASVNTKRWQHLQHDKKVLTELID